MTRLEIAAGLLASFIDKGLDANTAAVEALKYADALIELSGEVIEKQAKVTRQKKPIDEIGQAFKTLCANTWEAYEIVYMPRYQTKPVRNTMTNSLIVNLCKRLGEEAPHVIQFYVSLNDQFYLNAMHDLKLCVRDAESLRARWVTGKTSNRSHYANSVTDNAKELMQRIDRGEI